MTWDEIISFSSLYKAHKKARLSKRHKDEVIEFENNLCENLWKLHFELKYKKYFPSEYKKFFIYDPKLREIQAPCYRDKLVQHLICDNYLSPLLEKRLIYDNCACRKNKGISFALKRFRSFMTRYFKQNKANGYFVKIDVKKYFPSIDHDVLKRKLSKVVKDEDMFDLLVKIIDSFNFLENKGLPMGNQSSQCFALLYLDRLDRFFKESLRVKFYMRYMDDIMILIQDKKVANSYISIAKKLLSDEKLLLNPKSQIYSMKGMVQFLGWNFFYDDNGKINQTLLRRTRLRIKKR